MDNPIKSSAEWIEAEHFRKTEKFAEALSVFLSFFEKNSDESSLWRAVHCARKIGDFELAFKLIEENKQFLKTSPALNTQLNWLKYEALVDKNKKAGNWEKVLDACEDILQQNNDETDLLFKLTLFCAIDAAKKLNDNMKVLELTESIAPSKLPGEGEMFRGKKLLSYRERWYFARIGALYDAALYKECRKLAFEAISNYPRKIEFSRKAALSRLMMGYADEAEEELLAISKIRGCPWYIIADLAKLRFEKGEFEDALESAFEAAKMYGDLKTKVNVFSLIAKIQLVLGESESAKNHTLLACSIRKRNGWKYSSDLEQLAMRFGLDERLPAQETLFKICETEWKRASNKETEQAINDGNIIKNSLLGTVGSIIEGRPFTFLKCENGQDAYARCDDIPQESRFEGAKVIFDLAESFDKTKNKKSVRAVGIKSQDCLKTA